jgi:hypothetical protein
MSKKLTEISPDLTIPGFDVKVHSPHSCQVKSQDGRYEFSVEINESNQDLILSGNMLRESYKVWVGDWGWMNAEYTTDADDAITQFAKSLKLMDKLSSEGFSAKIDGSDLVLSHPSKPDYKLRMDLADARKVFDLGNTSPRNGLCSWGSANNKYGLYTRVTYCGPAYDEEANQKWKLGRSFYSDRLIVTNQDFEELAQEIKTRILSMGENGPGIAQWISEEIEKELLPQGVTFAPKPEKGIVEFSHPTGLSGTLSFAPFTVGDNYDINPKFPNLQFPTDIEREKVVLFTLDRRNYREPYTKGFLAKEPQEVIDEFRQFLAISLVYQEVCKAWKSDLLVPKLRQTKMLLVNTELDDKHIILNLTRENDRLVLRGMGEEFSYPILDNATVVDTKAITRAIVERAEKHVQEFSQKTGYIHSKVVEVPELDF